MRDQPAAELGDLIAPLPIETFFRDFWGRRPFVRQGASDGRVGGLFSVEAMDRVISGSPLSHPHLQLVRDSQNLARRSYLKLIPCDTTSSAVPDVGAVARHYRDGATIMLNLLQHSWPPVAEFCHRLEEVFGCPVGATAFLSPPNLAGRPHRQAFTAHYDIPEQFIVQISGSKRWRIYDAPFPLPLPDQHGRATDVAPGACQQDVVLRPGDVIYLPRGQFHEVATSDEPSLHLTFTIAVYTWMDALGAAIQALSADPRFREGLPLGALTPGGSRDFEAGFKRIKDLAMELLSVGEAAARLRSSFEAARRPMLTGHLARTVEADRRQPAAEHACGAPGAID